MASWLLCVRSGPHFTQTQQFHTHFTQTQQFHNTGSGCVGEAAADIRCAKRLAGKTFKWLSGRINSRAPPMPLNSFWSGVTARVRLNSVRSERRSDPQTLLPSLKYLTGCKQARLSHSFWANRKPFRGLMKKSTQPKLLLFCLPYHLLLGVSARCNSQANSWHEELLRERP